MSFDNYLNMERISIDLITENLNLMTNDSFPIIDFDDFEALDKIDYSKFKNNLKRGFLISTIICSLFEVTINNILMRSVKYNHRILESSLENKLFILSVNFNFDYDNLKEHHLFANYKYLNKIRNELIHFKYNNIGNSMFITSITFPFLRKNDTLEKIFIKSVMQKYFEDAIDLIKLIAIKCNFNINLDCGLFGCESDDFVDYIYN